jgi:hypothetical protein
MNRFPTFLCFCVIIIFVEKLTLLPECSASLYLYMKRKPM